MIFFQNSKWAFDKSCMNWLLILSFILHFDKVVLQDYTYTCDVEGGRPSRRSDRNQQVQDVNIDPLVLASV